MWRRTARDRVFIAFLVLATITVLTLDFRTGVLDGVAGTTRRSFNTFQDGVRAFVRPFESVVRSIDDLGSLRDENRKLREENRRLRRQQRDLRRRRARERARQARCSSSRAVPGVRAVHARVIGASLSGLERSATINKGRGSGSSRDRAVLAPEGLVGRVSWAGGSSAKVLLLTDAQSAVGVRIGESGETGLARGTGGRNLELELVSRAALDQGAVKPGDIVLTSGYQGGIYPAGLPGRPRRARAPRRARDDVTRSRVRPFVRVLAARHRVRRGVVRARSSRRHRPRRRSRRTSAR